MTAPKPARLPLSTYRLQLHAGFAFRDAEAVIPYLRKLGISECYCSSVLAARPGSSHGYDICDHSRLNPELGTPEDFEAFSASLRANEMGLILDFVPNHMGTDPSANLWWRSVLENGPSSQYAKYFDIDWDPVKDELKGKLLLPILGNQYGIVLESGQLQLQYDGRFLWLQYFDYNLPLNPRTLAKLLRHRLESLQAALGPEDLHLREYLSILFQLDHLPVYTATDPTLSKERWREKEVARERLQKLVENSPRLREHIEENVRIFNGEPRKPETYDLLHDLLETQPYRLSYWSTALHEINYRRFFDINELAGLRMEDPDVFEAAHRLLFSWIRAGTLTGLRLDHVDGLFDPAEYLKRLATCCPEVAPFYILAEKILSPGEPLRPDWMFHGTTGYEFLNELNGLFVDSSGSARFRRLYERFTGQEYLFSDVMYESKKLIIMTSMVSELNVLARELNRISEETRRFRDFTLASLQEALREVVACFPVYRAYFSEQGWNEFDEKAIDTAIARALRRNPAMEPSIFGFLRQMLLPTRADCLSDSDYERHVRFAMKFQQYTGPVQAKGQEDTAFYRYAPLLSLNEVGGDPTCFGRSPDEFHRINRERLQSWPFSMLATSTHDTKRGEDARARINVLSEMPEEWRQMISRWARTNAGMRTVVEGLPAPDRNDEYLYYQTLLGCWPAEHTEEPDAEFVSRMRQYMQKATKEAKTHTSWIHPSEEYDAAVSQFVRRTLTGSHAKRFLGLFEPFQRRIAWLGMLNSLSQMALKIACPGVPDFYQGTELWDLNLVDPDNRRPVDYEQRRRLLEQMEPLLNGWSVASGVREMLTHWQDGRIKLYLTAAGLRLRRKFPKLLLEGDYLPLLAEGEKRNHVVALARALGSQTLLTLVPRLVAGLVGQQADLPPGRELWQETCLVLPPEMGDRTYRNIFTWETIRPVRQGERATVPVGDVLRLCPVAVLLSADAHTV
ncbi:MAG: malto-oligosyltrehalose synthase [Acidobacteria bacterium]|nr:malto-oligosyltrehalose synthase [Acidobacteriota bacterium]